MSPSLYYAPTYFSPFYFTPLVSLGDLFPPQVPGPAYRDRDAYAALVDALMDTGEFARVILGDSLDRAAIGADCVPLAVIVPEEWTELDDVDPPVSVRHVTFTITLVVRDENAEVRFLLLDFLTSVVQNAVDGSGLGGGCLPALTKVRRGRYGTRSRPPEQLVSLTGEFSYLISGPSDHDTTP